MAGMYLGLKGKVAIVTGATSGIGAGSACELARAGACVVVIGRQEDALHQTAETIERDGGMCHPIRIDLTADGAPEQVVQETVTRFGTIDILVHSAGIFEPAPFAETSLESLDRRWAINVRAPFALSQASLPYLKPGSSIIFLSSVAGVAGFAGATGYCTTKGAVELLMKSMAVELAPAGIRVNSIAPGNVHTNMNAHLFALPGYEEQQLAGTPAGRIGTVTDIAPTVVFLASDASSYYCGATIVVDGGMTAK